MHAGMHEVKPHPHRKRAADQTGNDRKKQIERADILMIRRTEPADKKSRLVIVMIVMGARLGRETSSFPFLLCKFLVLLKAATEVEGAICPVFIVFDFTHAAN